MKNKKNLVLGTVSICIFLFSLTFAILNAAIPFDFLTHPILNFLLCLFVGFGTVALVLAFKNRSPWYFFLSAALLGLSVLYVTLNLLWSLWWLCIIIFVVLLAIFAIISIMVAGNKTEDIALNKSPDYKTFEQRKAEEKEKEEGEKANKPLPKIKSFKD